MAKTPPERDKYSDIEWVEIAAQRTMDRLDGAYVRGVQNERKRWAALLVAAKALVLQMGDMPKGLRYYDAFVAAIVKIEEADDGTTD